MLFNLAEPNYTNMKTNDQQLGMPIQCIQTKQAFIDGYGEERAMDIIDRNIKSLTDTHFQLNGNAELKLQLAFQLDFWTQTKEADLKFSPMKLLKEAKEKLYAHNLDPVGQQLDANSPDYAFLILLDTLID